MGKILRLTESELVNLVKRVIKEQKNSNWDSVIKYLQNNGYDNFKFVSAYGDGISLKDSNNKMGLKIYANTFYDIYDLIGGEVKKQGHWSWDGEKLILKNPEPVKDWNKLKNYFSKNLFSGKKGKEDFDEEYFAETVTFEYDNGRKIVFYSNGDYRFFDNDSSEPHIGMWDVTKKNMNVADYMIDKFKK